MKKEQYSFFYYNIFNLYIKKLFKKKEFYNFETSIYGNDIKNYQNVKSGEKRKI